MYVLVFEKFLEKLSLALRQKGKWLTIRARVVAGVELHEMNIPENRREIPPGFSLQHVKSQAVVVF